MKKVEHLHAFEQIKLLSDTHRMDILRLLMAQSSTLTQLARVMGKSPAWVRHHILVLEAANLVELAETRTTGRVTEKFYRARASALLLQDVILPKSRKPVVIFSGSHDLAIEGIASHLARHVTLLSLPVGSLDGLVNLRQGLCQVSGAHILDENGEYNTLTIRHIFPDREMDLVTLAYRTQGLIVAAGNPKSIKSIADLTHPGLRFVNRNAGSGTRLWLDAELRRSGIAPEAIGGYQTTVKTHSEAALLIQTGQADVSVGLQAAAHQHGLDFIPLFEERYDLVLPREQESALTPLLDYLQTLNFRKSLTALTGYNPSHTGKQIRLSRN